jgi:acyl-CoA thioesterase-1
MDELGTASKRLSTGARTRRRWLADCSLLALAGAFVGAAPSHAQGTSASAAGASPTEANAIGGVMVLGDSLSAEYGLKRGSGWVALLAERLTKEGIAVPVVNASISGDTTSGGRSRLAPLLRQHRPAVVVVELGANDALRGLPLTMTRDNLAAIVRDCQAAGAKVVVVGMQVPPNYGRKYSDDFAALFASVAREAGAALVPFLLKGVADGPDAEAMFQADRIHPKETAHPAMLDNVWPVLKPLLPKRR